MNVRHVCCFLALLIVGCSEPQENRQVVEQTVTVKTAGGDKKVVPLSELYDQTSGAPAFEGVLVIDRQKNREVFVSPDDLKGQTQANARYVLVSSSSEPPASDGK